jgi:hypothetical protein
MIRKEHRQVREVFTINRAAKYLGINVVELNIMCREKKIIFSTKNGKRFFKQDYLRWFKENTKIR